MRPRVDLAAEELAGGTNGDTCDLASQALLGARRLELDLLLRGCEDARAFGARRALGLLDQLVGAVLRMVDDLVGALTRLADDGVRLVACLGELLLAFLGGRFIEGSARQPELLPVLRVQMFLVAGLLDAVAMIGIGFALFFTFANPFLSAVQAAH